MKNLKLCFEFEIGSMEHSKPEAGKNASCLYVCSSVVTFTRIIEQLTDKEVERILWR
jgi:hypothetical protein